VAHERVAPSIEWNPTNKLFSASSASSWSTGGRRPRFLLLDHATRTVLHGCTGRIAPEITPGLETPSMYLSYSNRVG
jgi:hypothetical protein